jgi:hypothetical protein
MAFQGNLREFAITEMLQLLGSQKKTGCLVLERETERRLYVHQGAIVSTRKRGMLADDPLLRFLRRIHRLSDDQVIALTNVQRASGRDFEDLLGDGGYVQPEDLPGYIERQILDDLTEMIEWNEGAYYFNAHDRWDGIINMRLSSEAALIEAARRADERKRFRELFKDPWQILTVTQLPDPDLGAGPEEAELFGLIDGERTAAEVAAAAGLTDYEAFEALQRMMESGWIHFNGRREGGGPLPSMLAPPKPIASSRARRLSHTGMSLLRELALTVILVASVYGLGLLGHAVQIDRPAPRLDDPFIAAQFRDVRLAVDLFHRERGIYPRRLDDLVADRWLSQDQIEIGGAPLQYRVDAEHDQYRLDLPKEEP